MTDTPPQADATGTPFAELPPDQLAAVAEYAYSGDPDVTFVDDDVQDTDAPHGQNPELD